MTLGKRIRELRLKMGLTQQDVAEKLNTSRGNYSNYETDRKAPGKEKLKKLAEIFGTSVDYLLGNTDDPTPTEQIKKDVQSSTPDLMKILADTKPHYGGRELTKEEADMLIDFLEFMLKKAEKKKKRPN